MIENKKLEGAIQGVSQCTLASKLKINNPKPIIVELMVELYYCDFEAFQKEQEFLRSKDIYEKII